MNELIILTIMLFIFFVPCCIIYPAVMIIYYKVYKHSKKTILQIIDEI